MNATTYENTHTPTASTSDDARGRSSSGIMSGITRRSIWIGRVMSGLVIVFLLLASAFPKFFLPELANASMRQLGFPERHLLLLGCIEVVGTLLYALPRTATLGAICLTGLFGGAVASHLRIDAPLASHTLFPIYIGLLMWGGLWFRNARVRHVLPFSK